MLIKEENHQYWNNRAEGYSKVNQEELEGEQHEKWGKLLETEIQSVVFCENKTEVKVLDIGAGPGFLSIVLAELGYDVTAADYSEEMLARAEFNANQWGVRINYCREDAESLSFESNSFDVIISRNLTWNLPNTGKAYNEWLRVLKPGGIMLVFDANWYSYLKDENLRKAYDLDRENVAAEGYEDYNIGENFDHMEAIAQSLPMTVVVRPEWDRKFFLDMNSCAVEVVDNIGETVYSHKEKTNYKSTPMFMIKVIKG